MNLAYRDIRHNAGRFVLTAVGIGLLLMIVLGMAGIYRGLVEDATLMVDRIAADLWIVQKDTRGPFAELSRLPANVEDRARVVPGVARSSRFVSHTIQREHEDKPLRMVVQGLSWPDDRGDWLPLVAGRPLRQAHFEIVADRSLGLRLGQRIRLGKDDYSVVGLTSNMLGSGGDGAAFLTLADAQAVQFDQAGQATRAEREARRARVRQAQVGQLEPEKITRAAGPTQDVVVLAPPAVSAVLVHLDAGADPQAVAAAIRSWGDVSVYTHSEQRDLLLKGNVDRARRQLLLFRTLLVIVSTIIMALILYTLTLDKLHDIALLKLIGARNRVIFGLVLQQALVLGAVGYGVAWLIGGWVFPRFPRRVVIVDQDLLLLAGVVVGISILASLLGIWRALKVQPNEVLA